LIRHSSKDTTKVNLEVEGKNYDKKEKKAEFDTGEGYVCIRNGDLVCGVLDKSILGGGKNNLFQLLLRDYGYANRYCDINAVGMLFAVIA
jgi:DNA-directed RNA polymerase III subunit RPC1